MNAEEKVVTVTIPHRISGFFEIVDNPKQDNNREIEEKIGSRGAGFNLTGLGRTRLSYQKLNPSENSECEIFINGEQLNENAETTYYIFDRIKNSLQDPLKVVIEHFFDLPVGCGYGASGSGALGTIFGLNKLLSLGFSRRECCKRAHISEVVNKTGLGTVCGQLQGGLCILKEPGFPCVSSRINVPKDLKVICGTFGPIKTKSILSNPDLNSRIKKCGAKAMKKLTQAPTINTFIKASIEFVEEIELMEILNLTEIKELVINLNNLKVLGASMNQLGRSVYCICHMKEIDNVLEVFKTYEPEIKTFIFEINEDKPIKYL
jgi:pantoate kinase